MAPLAGAEPTKAGNAAAAWIARFDAPVPGAASGPLAGLRFAIKDNIDAAGVPTTAACPAFERLPAEHAHV
ncbi:MAG: amidase family protein, partial [Solirubrobacteraceae bacterium]|nr:amidase family protein [Solirubrobacteraceae bacterium]